MAHKEGRFAEFCCALGFRPSQARSLTELARLGDPVFHDAALSWAEARLATATGGREVKLGWRPALKHVLQMIGRADDASPEQPEAADGSDDDEATPDDVDDEDDAHTSVLYAEIHRLEAELETRDSALDIAKKTFREARVQWAARSAAQDVAMAEMRVQIEVLNIPLATKFEKVREVVTDRELAY